MAIFVCGSFSHFCARLSLSARSMPERLASLSASLLCMCARFGRGSVHLVCARRCACRLDLANIHRHAHHSSRRRWSCGAIWSDMQRTCATCHEYSWHAPFVSSNFMVVVTNGGHSRSGRHSWPHAPFCTVLGADWGWRLSAHRACEQDAVHKLGGDVDLVQF